MKVIQNLNYHQPFIKFRRKMFYPSEIRNEELRYKRFIDFDKQKEIFYDNLYLDEYHWVIKIPMIIESKQNEDLKVEKFDLTKYTYLISYD